MTTSLFRIPLLLTVFAGSSAACAQGASDGDDSDGTFADAGALPDSGLAASPDADVGPMPLNLTQSTSMAITADNSVACFNGEVGYTLEASYYRVFDLPQLGISDAITIDALSIGIENAVGGAGASQPAKVVLHSLSQPPSGGVFLVANLTTLASADIQVADQATAVLEVPLAANVPAGTRLVAELLVPDGSADGNLLFPGSNAAGESGPTYVRDGCGGADDPIEMTQLDVTNMHWVLSLSGAR